MKALALLLLLLAGCADAHPGDIRPYALRVQLDRGHCSATAVGPDVLLTAGHCFGEGRRIVSINGQAAYALKMVRDRRDAVLVRVNLKFDKWAKLGSQPRTGDRIRMVANPNKWDGVYLEGYVSRSRQSEIMLDIQAFSGVSGAGLFDASGRVVAVVSEGWLLSAPSGHHLAMTIAFPLAFTPQDWKAIK